MDLDPTVKQVAHGVLRNPEASRVIIVRTPRHLAATDGIITLFTHETRYPEICRALRVAPVPPDNGAEVWCASWWFTPHRRPPLVPSPLPPDRAEDAIGFLDHLFDTVWSTPHRAALQPTMVLFDISPNRGEVWPYRVWIDEDRRPVVFGARFDGLLDRAQLVRGLAIPVRSRFARRDIPAMALLSSPIGLITILPLQVGDTADADWDRLIQMQREMCPEATAMMVRPAAEVAEV